jgi:hypothetical protein
VNPKDGPDLVVKRKVAGATANQNPVVQHIA